MTNTEVEPNHHMKKEIVAYLNRAKHKDQVAHDLSRAAGALTTGEIAEHLGEPMPKTRRILEKMWDDLKILKYHQRIDRQCVWGALHD